MKTNFKFASIVMLLTFTGILAGCFGSVGDDDAVSTVVGGLDVSAFSDVEKEVAEKVFADEEVPQPVAEPGATLADGQERAFPIGSALVRKADGSIRYFYRQNREDIVANFDFISSDVCSLIEKDLESGSLPNCEQSKTHLSYSIEYEDGEENYSIRMETESDGTPILKVEIDDGKDVIFYDLYKIEGGILSQYYTENGVDYTRISDPKLTGDSFEGLWTGAKNIIRMTDSIGDVLQSWGFTKDKLTKDEQDEDTTIAKIISDNIPSNATINVTPYRSDSGSNRYGADTSPVTVAGFIYEGKYSGFGVWDYAGDNNDRIFDDAAQYFFYGLATPLDITTRNKGMASYKGFARGAYKDIRLSGGADLTLNFDKAGENESFAGDVRLVEEVFNPYSVDVKLKGKFDSDGFGGASTVTFATGDLTLFLGESGTFNGRFFGPDADEATGVLGIMDKEGVDSLHAGFITFKQEEPTLSGIVGGLDVSAFSDLEKEVARTVFADEEVSQPMAESGATLDDGQERAFPTRSAIVRQPDGSIRYFYRQNSESIASFGFISPDVCSLIEDDLKPDNESGNNHLGFLNCEQSNSHLSYSIGNEGYAISSFISLEIDDYDGTPIIKVAITYGDNDPLYFLYTNEGDGLVAHVGLSVVAYDDGFLDYYTYVTTTLNNGYLDEVLAADISQMTVNTEAVLQSWGFIEDKGKSIAEIVTMRISDNIPSNATINVTPYMSDSGSNRYGVDTSAVEVEGFIYEAKYSGFGVWDYAGDNNDRIFDDAAQYFLYGLATPESGIPTDGTASYKGFARGAYKDIRLSGGVDFTVDFASPNVANTFTGNVMLTSEESATAPAHSADVQLEGTFDSDGFYGTSKVNTGTGRLMPTFFPYAGEFDGSFFGPDADEATGVLWIMDEGREDSLHAGFITFKQGEPAAAVRPVE